MRTADTITDCLPIEVKRVIPRTLIDEWRLAHPVAEIQAMHDKWTEIPPWSREHAAKDALVQAAHAWCMANGKDEAAGRIERQLAERPKVTRGDLMLGVFRGDRGCPKVSLPAALRIVGTATHGVAGNINAWCLDLIQRADAIQVDDVYSGTPPPKAASPYSRPSQAVLDLQHVNDVRRLYAADCRVALAHLHEELLAGLELGDEDGDGDGRHQMVHLGWITRKSRTRLFPTELHGYNTED